MVYLGWPGQRSTPSKACGEAAGRLEMRETISCCGFCAPPEKNVRLHLTLSPHFIIVLRARIDLLDSVVPLTMFSSGLAIGSMAPPGLREITIEACENARITHGLA